MFAAPTLDMTDTERAHAGAMLLDHREPDWFRRIDKSKLRLYSTVDCIVGQVKPEGYTLGMVNLGLRPEEAVRYGFAWPTAELHEAWLREIESRQQAGVRELAGVA